MSEFEDQAAQAQVQKEIDQRRARDKRKREKDNAANLKSIADHTGTIAGLLYAELEERRHQRAFYRRAATRLLGAAVQWLESEARGVTDKVTNKEDED